MNTAEARSAVDAGQLSRARADNGVAARRPDVVDLPDRVHRRVAETACRILSRLEPESAWVVVAADEKLPSRRAGMRDVTAGQYVSASAHERAAREAA